MKLIGIAGLKKEKFSFLKKKNHKVKLIKISDENFYKNNNLNALIIFGEWAVKKKLSKFLRKKFYLFKNLEWVHLSRAGIDEFKDSITNYKFKFTCGKKIQGPNVSEHCFALLLNLTRGINGYDKKKFRPTEIYKKNILITGLGGIGISIAKKLSAFGAIVSSARLNPKIKYSFVKRNYNIRNLKNIVDRFDIIINTTPLTDKTINLFNKEIFKNMKKGVFFVNVSRRDVVNLVDLEEYIKKNKFGGVGLDVHDTKDNFISKSIKKYNNVIFTNHEGGITTDEIRRFDLLKENLSKYIKKKKLLNIVDVKKQY